MKAYTGIGSRETPPEILKVMAWLGETLADARWTLRSGCAPGADSAFEGGAKSAMNVDNPGLQLFLPWAGFEDRGNDGWRYFTIPQPEAYEIAQRFHPSWRKLTRGGRALHARNVHQILGPDVTNPVLSRYVVCWTRGGEGGGGTGQALRIATHYGVPVFDLAKQDDYDRIAKFVGV